MKASQVRPIPNRRQQLVKQLASEASRVAKGVIPGFQNVTLDSSLTSAETHDF